MRQIQIHLIFIPGETNANIFGIHIWWDKYKYIWYLYLVRQIQILLVFIFGETNIKIWYLYLVRQVHIYLIFIPGETNTNTFGIHTRRYDYKHIRYLYLVRRKHTIPDVNTLKGLPTMIPGGLSKEQEEAYLCKFSSLYFL